MFCTHNPVDLRIGLTRKNEADHVVVRCRMCKRHLGRSYPLFDLVSTAVKRNHAMADALEAEKQKRQAGEKEDSEEE
jgi:hypothetical protein